MKICVFLGSKTGMNPIFGKKVGELCEEISKRKFEIVYGGGSIGLMGLLADTAIHYGIPIYGVIPSFLAEKELAHQNLNQTIFVNSMSERKEKMIAMSDAFLVLPGGIGTMDEFFEVFTYKQLRLIDKPIAILNTSDYYQTFKKFLVEMVKEGFLNLEDFESLIISASIPYILDKFVEFYS
ncbi:MAG: TIGR00730 family Rossman fold protein [Leptospiraceae bacterium]|nr:TIGR00730 family Rossman fold protein [Leptospiraceae bacterium]MDW7975017.1 TIGR00730 family Rossman fold protein [Leptospiraceae bacterium]